MVARGDPDNWRPPFRKIHYRCLKDTFQAFRKHHYRPLKKKKNRTPFKRCYRRRSRRCCIHLSSAVKAPFSGTPVRHSGAIFK